MSEAVRTAPNMDDVKANINQEDKQPPVLPETFQVSFDESATFGLKTEGKLWYDYEHLVERVDRENGKGDRYCGAAKFLKNTPCTHLTANGTRYLIYDELDFCCTCCYDENGCGVLRRDFLSEAKYVGEEKIFGIEAEHWEVIGLQKNGYWETKDGQPVRLTQGGTDDMVFKSDFSTESIDPDVFAVPEGCSKNLCSGTCALVRKMKI